MLGYVLFMNRGLVIKLPEDQVWIHFNIIEDLKEYYEIVPSRSKSLNANNHLAGKYGVPISFYVHHLGHSTASERTGSTPKEFIEFISLKPRGLKDLYDY